VVGILVVSQFRHLDGFDRNSSVLGQLFVVGERRSSEPVVVKVLKERVLVPLLFTGLAMEETFVFVDEERRSFAERAIADEFGPLLVREIDSVGFERSSMLYSVCCHISPMQQVQ
jgi:hypothetical protein